MYYVVCVVKFDLLIELLDEYCDEMIFIFGCIKYGMEKLVNVFEKKGFGVEVVYGNKS